MNLFRGLIAVILMTGTGVVLAGDIRAGMWEIHLVPQVTGIPVPIPAQTQRQCLKKDMPVPQTQQDMPKGCNIKTDIKGSQVSWTIQCKTKEGEMTGNGMVTYTGEQLSGHAVMNMQGMSITTTMSGRRVGDC